LKRHFLLSQLFNIPPVAVKSRITFFFFLFIEKHYQYSNIMGHNDNSTSYYQISSFDAEPFADYQTTSNEPGLGFYSFVLVYTFLAFLIIAPLVSWSRNREEKKLKELDEQRQESIQHRSSKDDSKLLSKQEDDVIISNDGDQKTQNCDDRISKGGRQQRTSSSSSIGTKNDITAEDSKRNTTKTVTSSSRSRRRTALRSVVLRELDHSYPDRDPDFQNHILRSSAGGIPQQFHNTTRKSQDQQRVLQQQGNGGGNSKQPIETSSSASAATTSKIYQNSNNPSNKGFSKRVLDVGGRRWKNRRPIGRVDVISNVIVNSSKNNPPSIIGSKKKVESSPGQKKASLVSSSNSNSIMKGGRSRLPQTQLRQSYFGMSDVASSILSEQYHQLHSQPKIQIDISMMKKYQLEQLQQQQQFQMQQQQHFLAMHRLAALEKQQQQRRYSQRKTNRSGSRSIAASERSAMSSIVDDISPDDAPDAKDPGKGNIFIETDEKYWNTELQYSNQGGGDGGEFNTQVGCCSAPLEGLLALAVPDQNKKIILRASIPLALGASSEALFRLITIAFISRFLGTESMIGMLLNKVNEVKSRSGPFFCFLESYSLFSLSLV
jgi:hypothetical protein